MTVLVGALCKDGVVIGSDSSATFGPHQNFSTIEQPTDKTFVIEADVLLAGTGSVGLGQRFSAVVSGIRKQPDWDSRTEIEKGKLFSAGGLSEFSQTFLKPGQYGSLVAYEARGKLHLCEFAIQDFQPEWKTAKLWFASMGSGQTIVDPFLGLMRRVFFPSDQPTLAEGLFLVTWALEHAIDVNPGGINAPIQLGVLTIENGQPIARLLESSELEDHRANVQSAEAHLANYTKQFRASPNLMSPSPPS